MSTARSVIKRIALTLNISRGKTSEWLVAETKQQVNKWLNTFVDQQIDTIEIFDYRGRIDRDLVSSFDVFLAGSDQVWRKVYADVPSYMFDFLDDSPKSRFSYAASFGLDNVDEYGSELLTSAADLLGRFSSVSVRESSGVALCAEHFGISAQQHVDPTLLLTADDYRSLLHKTQRRSPGHVVSYVLDKSRIVNETIGALNREYGSSVTDLSTFPPATYQEFLSDRDRYVRPSVEDWLASIEAAEIVITDSFHGTVFSILFNRPFVVFANATRGASRFESLLSRFGLESRLVSSVDESLAAAAMPIDWARVNDLVSDERDRGRAFIEKNVKSSLSRSS